MSKFWGDTTEPIKEEKNILPGLDAGDLALLYGEYLDAHKGAYNMAENLDFIKVALNLWKGK